MAKTLLVMCLMISSCTVFAQTDSTDFKAIRSEIRKLNEIWNKHDMDAYCALFTEDATWVNILGMFWQNRADLCTAHKVIKEFALKYWTAEMKVVKIRFAAPDVALVYIYETAHVEHDYEVPNHKFKKGDIFHDQLFLIYTRKESEWKISAGQNTTVDDTMVKYDPIKSK